MILERGAPGRKGKRLHGLPLATVDALIDEASGKVVCEFSDTAAKLLGEQTRLLVITKPGAVAKDKLCLQLLDGDKDILWEYELQVISAAGREIGEPGQ